MTGPVMDSLEENKLRNTDKKVQLMTNIACDNCPVNSIFSKDEEELGLGLELATYKSVSTRVLVENACK